MDEQKNKVGIGGWLILVLINLIITPIRIGISVFNDLIPLFDSMSSFNEYATLKVIIYIEVICNVIFGVFAVILLIMMINKDRRFPKLMIIFYVSNLIFIIASAICVSQMPLLDEFLKDGDSTKEIVRSFIGTAIWVLYMLVSTRVKNTFLK